VGKSGKSCDAFDDIGPGGLLQDDNVWISLANDRPESLLATDAAKPDVIAH
jgi:hypothetical protein